MLTYAADLARATMSRYALALEHRDYRMMWMANFSAQAAAWALIVSRAWFVYDEMGMSSGKGPRRREGGPSSGASALITSPPREASSLPQYGPATISATSSTRSPARAWGELFALMVSIGSMRPTTASLRPATGTTRDASHAG